MAYSAEFQAHLDSGTTTLARCFAMTRRDGAVFGFTDHDRDLGFDGITFRADSGLTARALAQATGLAVDNSEVFGALTSAALGEEDILAGRYDGAEIVVWLVNWTDVASREVLLRGTLGEITRTGGAFTAELRGLTEALNRPQGRIYHARCSAVLGDRGCGFDLGQAGYRFDLALKTVEDARVMRVDDPGGLADRWFEKGRLTVLSGRAAGLGAAVRLDRAEGAVRVIELWQALGIAPAPGDMVRIEAGCDRRAATCRLKFANLVNFQGFPDIPGDDWVMSYPGGAEPKDGGSRRG